MTGGLAFIVNDENWLDGGTTDFVDTSSRVSVERLVNPDTVAMVILSPGHKYVISSPASKPFLNVDM
jgi:hypothetical protein